MPPWVTYVRMHVVSYKGYMRARFGVHCTREMPHRRCVLVRVPEDVTMHATVGRWAPYMFARGRRQEGRFPGCMCHVKKGLQSVRRPNPSWSPAGTVCAVRLVSGRQRGQHAAWTVQSSIGTSAGRSHGCSRDMVWPGWQRSTRARLCAL